MLKKSVLLTAISSRSRVAKDFTNENDKLSDIDHSIYDKLSDFDDFLNDDFFYDDIFF